MDVAALLEPISADAPCGPDLAAEDDDAFLEYFYEAVDRLPARYYDQKTGEPFDRKSVDLKGETAQIGALLARSRDLRLLVLEAQFQILAGKLDGFIDCVLGMARLLETWPNDVHPRTDDDATDRRNAIELLDSRVTVVIPLEQATLLVDRRLDAISWQMYAVATGRRPAREGEAVADSGGILSAFKNADNAAAVETLFARVSDCAAALKAISLACITADRNPFGPGLEQVNSAVKAVLEFLVEMRPDLDPAAAAAAAAASESSEAEGEPGAAPASGGGAPAVSGPIRDHAGADAALAAAEAYFVRREPSSPALFLVRQSRALIGRPLVEALQSLLPDVVERARLDFGAGDDFAMGMDKMRELSILDPQYPDEPPPEVPPAESRDRAAALMTAVESFFRQVEPSSPIPVLLFRAKTFQNRDFSAIVADLFPRRD